MCAAGDWVTYISAFITGFWFPHFVMFPLKFLSNDLISLSAITVPCHGGGKGLYADTEA